MAELAVTSALALIELVSPFLSSLNLNEDLLGEMKSMKVWLRSMKAFIEDNDGPEGSRTLRDQVEQFRDIAYEIEDVLEEFVRHSPHAFHNHKISQRVHKLAHNFKHGFPLRKTSDKIAAIKKSIEGIKSQNAAFAAGSSSSRQGSSSGLRTGGNRVSPLLLDDEIVGYENEKVDFIRELLDREKRFVTLAVAGPGGSGKTTFVKNIFWKRGVWGQFDCHAWVHVSRDFDVDKILINSLKQFCLARKEPYPTDESVSIHDKLKKYLANKTYIVVLDDIWSTADWNCIKDAFPNSFRGSRVIVTTRDSSVASLSASSQRYVYCFNSLAWLDAWTLFCRKAFEDNNRECPAELKDCSVRIVKRCEGLPLAIVAVGGALAQKPKLPFEWENFHRNLGCEIGSDSHMSVISNSLLPSYMDLSSNLKSCFLYFSVFPEDYSVEHGRLVRLWVAERFAMGTDVKTTEEVAADYLNELIHRNLVHVSNWDLDERPRNLRVLNLVRKFIIQKCKDENFAAILARDTTTGTNKIRRLSVHGDCTHLSHSIDSAGIRSFLLFRSAAVSPCDIWNNSSSFQLSRLIDLQGAPLMEFPVDICRLTLLRYVCFRDTKITEVPKSIAKLPHLETLDLKQTDVTELPKEISKLHNLRHLFAYKYNVTNYVDFDSVRGVKVHEGIGNLTKLQNLSRVRVDQKGRIIKDLKKLSQLRKLGLLGLKREHGADLCEAINSMEMLTTLDLCSASKEEYISLEQMSPPETLRRLYLKGRLTSVPDWTCSLNNLFRIHLKWSKLKASPLNSLARLPNLMEIHLVDCYIGAELVFEASKFKKLKNLVIEDFSELHTIVIQEGSMPDLQEISLRRCPKMVMLPLGMDSLSKVKELVLHDMADEFVARLRQHGDDHGMVEHIPVVHSFTLNNRGWSLENLSSSFYHRDVASANASNPW